MVANPGDAEQAGLQQVFSHDQPGTEDFGRADGARLHGRRRFDDAQTLAAQDQQDAEVLIVGQAGFAGGEN